MLSSHEANDWFGPMPKVLKNAAVGLYVPSRPSCVAIATRKRVDMVAPPRLDKRRAKALKR
jgi:hypothetical protein